MFIWKETKKRCNINASYIDEKGQPWIKVPSHLYEEIPDPAPPSAVQAYPDEYYINEIDDAPYFVYTKKSPEQIEQLKRQKAKQEREVNVSNIKVSISPTLVFDGDERSQDRMARAIISMKDTDKISWVLHNNTVAQVTKAELQEALRLAGLKMAELWVKPYGV